MDHVYLFILLLSDFIPLDLIRDVHMTSNKASVVHIHEIVIITSHLSYLVTFHTAINMAAIKEFK